MPPAPAEAPATYDASPVHSAYDAAVVAAYDSDASRAGFEPAFAPSQPPREPEQAYDHHAFPAQTYGQEHSAAYGAEAPATAPAATAPAAMAPAATAPAVAPPTFMIPTAPESAPRATAPQSAAPQPRFMIPSAPDPTPDPSTAPISSASTFPAAVASIPPLAAETTPSYASETAPLPAAYSAYGGGAAAAANDTAGWGAAPAGGGAYGGGAYGGGAYGAYANDVSTAAYGADHQSSAYGADHQSSAYDFSSRAVPPPASVPPPALSVSRNSFDGPAAAAATYAPIDGGFGAYSAGGSDHAAGDAGTPRSPHGRPPCATFSFGFGGRLAVGAPGYPGGADPPAGSTPPGHVRIVRLADAIRESAPRLGDAGVRFLASLDRCRGPIHRNASVRDLAALGEEDDGDGEGDVAGDVAGARGLSQASSHGFSQASSHGFSGSSVSSGSADEDAKILIGVLRAMCKHRGALAGAGSRANDPSGTRPDGPGADLRDVLVGPGDGTPHASPASDAAANENPANAAAALAEYERLLLAGCRGEALSLATTRGLWSHALLLAKTEGEREFAAVAAAMARAACRPGTPLRTLELVLAGLSRELAGAGADSTTQNVPIAADLLADLLPRWREHVAILASNGAPGDREVLAALGDALWTRRGAVSAAHVSYVLAGASPTPFHPSARVCLVGADHRRFPRTYATPDAIQRTELLEHAARLANPQHVLGAFQPYKLHYAGLLAEFGRAKEALGYAETTLRAARSLDRGSRECDAAALAAAAAELEHRLRGHLGGRGGALKSAANSLFGGFSKMLDKGVHSLFGDEGAARGGGPGSSRPSGAPSAASSAANGVVSGTHSRNLSDASSVGSVAQDQRNAGSGPGGGSTGPGGHSTGPGSSEYGSSPARSSMWRQVSGVLGKVGAAIPLPKPKNQAKLGEENTMYYDEKLGRWVEPGKEHEGDVEPPPPPPTSFGPASSTQTTPAPSHLEISNPGTTPSPPGANAFSMRAPKGSVRSRYVDTFAPAGTAASPGTNASSPVLPPGMLPPGMLPGMLPGTLPGMIPGAPAARPTMRPMKPARPGAGGGFAVPDPEATARGEHADDAPLPLSPVKAREPDSAPATEPPSPVAAAEPPTVQAEDAIDASFGGGGGDDDALEDESRVDDEPSAASEFAPELAPPPPPPTPPMVPLTLTDVPEPPPPPTDLTPPEPSRGTKHISPVPTRTASNAEGAAFFVPGGASTEESPRAVGGAATTPEADEVYEDDVAVDDDDENNAAADADGFFDGSTDGVDARRDDDPFGDDPTPRSFWTETGDAEAEAEAETSSVADAVVNGHAHAHGHDLTTTGYYDHEGRWTVGEWPGGRYDDAGRWLSGYWTADRAWVAGYWNASGEWVSGEPVAGYYDATGTWTEGTWPGGVADESGRWRYGYYDATGSFVEGHFDDGGQWREGQPVGETKAAERVGGNGVGAEEVTEALGALSGLGGEVEGDGEMTEMPL